MHPILWRGRLSQNKFPISVRIRLFITLYKRIRIWLHFITISKHYLIGNLFCDNLLVIHTHTQNRLNKMPLHFCIHNIWTSTYQINRHRRQMIWSVKKTNNPTLLNSKKSLDWPYEHHSNHHDWKYGDGIASHPHYEQVHWNLLQWTKSNIPWFLKS